MMLDAIQCLPGVKEREGQEDSCLCEFIEDGAILVNSD